MQNQRTDSSTGETFKMHEQAIATRVTTARLSGRLFSKATKMRRKRLLRMT